MRKRVCEFLELCKWVCEKIEELERERSNFLKRIGLEKEAMLCQQCCL